MPIRVQERDVYVNTGSKSQTVKICDFENVRGQYEWYLRIRPPKLANDELELRVEELAVRGEGPEDLVRWLQVELAAIDEIDSGPVSDDGDLPAPTAHSLQAPPLGDWFPGAVVAVETELDRLADTFLRSPYRHRVEHSLHAEFWSTMSARIDAGDEYPLVNGTLKSRLVHKEWPEPVPRSRGRRGNFDIALLAPQQLEKCPDLAHFVEGWLWPPIAIEFGLDYPVMHLRGDLAKLRNSQRPSEYRGYAVHLVRGRSLTDAEIEELSSDSECVRTVCACVSPKGNWLKRVGDPSPQRV